jgi:ribosomal protein L35
MKKLNKEERKNRVIARGEHSNHAHIVTGKATIERKGGETLIHVSENDTATLRHLLEKQWQEGKEVWTEEHHDIALEPGTYKFIQQVEYNPINEAIVRVVD